MKMIFCLSILVCSFFYSCAQNEFYIPWSNPAISVYGISHILDNDGNIYFLGDINYFDTLNGGIVPEDPYSNVIVKINPNNNIEWMKQYGNYHPGAQLLLINNLIYIPYSFDIGYSICQQTGPVTITRQSAINAGLFINQDIGDTVINKIFYNSKQCGQQSPAYSYTDINGNISNIYSDDSFNIGFSPAMYIQQLNTTHNIISDTLFPIWNNINANDTNYFTALVYNKIGNNYILGDRNDIYTYTLSGKLLHSYALRSDGIPFKAMTNVHIAYNADYYVINCGLTVDLSGVSKYYTYIISQNGQLLSLKPSARFSDMIITDDNRILAVATGAADTLAQPLIFMEMDLFQNIKRKKLLGKPGVVANKISLNINKEVIITGTVYFTGMSDSFPRPGVLYYYHQEIDDIPLTNNELGMCNAVAVYPDPAKNTVNITSNDFNITNNSIAELYNAVGQQLGKTRLTEATTKFDISSFPVGLYFLKIRNVASSCVIKVEKQ